jgi:hypothetical protein
LDVTKTGTPDLPASTTSADENAAISFVEVLRDELHEISALRRKRNWSDGQNGQPEDEPPVAETASAQATKSGGDEAARKQQSADRVFGEAYKKSLVGLAFSGGGIRSATFNLGVLQGLAELNLLPMFDYLSTVSGGGYIGSWLCAWIWRSGQKTKVVDENPQEKASKCANLRTPPVVTVQESLKPERSTKPGHQEPRPIRFLREYSNYLTPRLGLLGADTWTAVGIYLRNLMLNQLILVLFLASVMLIPHIAIWITHLALEAKDLPGVGTLRFIAIFGLLLLALVVSTLNMKNLTGVCDQSGATLASPGPNTAAATSDKLKCYFPWYANLRWILLLVAAPLFVSAWIAATWLGESGTTWPWWFAPLIGLVVFGIAWTIASLWNLPAKGPAAPHWGKQGAWISSIFASFLSGAVGGTLLWLLANALFHHRREHIDGHWSVLTFGTPLVVLIFLVVGALQVGLMGLYFPDPRREWWARLGGYLLITAIVWTVLFTVSFYAPLGLMWAKGWVRQGIGLTWLASTLAGVVGGNSAKTGDPDSRSWKTVALAVTPYIFILGIASVIAWLVEITLAALSKQDQVGAFILGSPVAQKVTGWIFSLTTDGVPGFRGAYGNISPAMADTIHEWDKAYFQAHWALLKAEWTDWKWLLILLTGLLGVCAFLSWRINLNEFSMNLFYRNRLVRAYLGASHEGRLPNPFTGFDPHDELQLIDLRSENCYSGPFPIINAALNVVSGKDLAWQERKAESFVLTPQRCGFDTRLEQIDLDDEGLPEDVQRHGYRPTQHFAFSDEGLRLGTAVSISGAAASPNMGYHSSPSLAFLMTVFNVRLGYWAGNPRRDSTWQKPGPRWGLLYLLAELFGQTNDEARYIYLSDGGHFENLALYELVKRRCKYIVACDADCDNNYAFGDLGNAIRKCREDLGVEIEICTNHIGVKAPANGDDSSTSDVTTGDWHWAIGKIHYNLVDAGAEPGILVYLKTSTTGDEPADVANYRRLHAEFPHQTTANQWFSESQFESYRRLGQHVVEKVFEPLKRSGASLGDTPSAFTKSLFESLQKHWPMESEKSGKAADEPAA